MIAPASSGGDPLPYLELAMRAVRVHDLGKKLDLETRRLLLEDELYVHENFYREHHISTEQRERLLSLLTGG